MGPESSYNMARFKAVDARFTTDTETERLEPVDGKITPEDANSCYQGDDTDGGQWMVIDLGDIADVMSVTVTTDYTKPARV